MKCILGNLGMDVTIIDYHAPCLGEGGAQGWTGDLMAGCSLGLAITEPVHP